MRAIIFVVVLTGIGITCGLSNAEEPATDGGGAPASDEARPAPSVGFAWLAGTWRMTSGETECDEYWSDPRAGTQFGAFRITKGEQTLFYEVFALQRDGEDVSLRLRHFTPQLVSWKGEEEQVKAWKLADTAKRKAVFRSATSQISYERTAEDELLVRLQPIEEEGALGVGQTFRFKRQRYAGR